MDSRYETERACKQNYAYIIIVQSISEIEIAHMDVRHNRVNEMVKRGYRHYPYITPDR